MITVPLEELKEHRCPMSGSSCNGRCMLIGIDRNQDKEPNFFCLLAKACRVICIIPDHLKRLAEVVDELPNRY